LLLELLCLGPREYIWTWFHMQLNQWKEAVPTISASFINMLLFKALTPVEDCLDALYGIHKLCIFIFVKFVVYLFVCFFVQR
jgi:hypothetical protein